MDNEAIAAVRAALGDLNRALSALPALGIEAEIRMIDATKISDQAPHTIITMRLTRMKKEIDVQI